MPDDPTQLKLGQWGGPRVRRQQVSNVNLKSRGGNRRTYVLARLFRDRPDLAAKVESGEMSAHAAAVELGWVRRQQTVAVGENFNQTRRPPKNVDGTVRERRTVVDVKSLIG